MHSGGRLCSLRPVVAGSFVLIEDGKARTHRNFLGRIASHDFDVRGLLCSWFLTCPASALLLAALALAARLFSSLEVRGSVFASASIAVKFELGCFRGIPSTAHQSAHIDARSPVTCPPRPEFSPVLSHTRSLRSHPLWHLNFSH